MKKLSICIPTYNRSSFVISQLHFLKNEIQPFKEFIDVIVSDNFSDDEHRDILINYQSINKFFDLKLNNTNLGSIGNIYYLLDNTNSEYVWFLSDDDILLAGIVKRIMNILCDNNNISYLFLNYNAFIKNPNLIDHYVNLLGYYGYMPEGKQCIIDLFEENGTISMFITSCIYSEVKLKEFCTSRSNQTLIDPLLFSFKLALDPIYIEKEVFVLERCDNPSWKEEGLAIFSWQVQVGLIELLDHSYSKKDIIRMINSIYTSNKVSYLLMLLKAPIKYKKLIVFFLGFMQIRLLINSLIDYFRRKLVLS